MSMLDDPQPPCTIGSTRVRLDRASSPDMVHWRVGHYDCPSRANQPPLSRPSSIETIDPCRICLANFACAASTSPTASSFRQCANIHRSTATRMIGISRILPLARLAAPPWYFTEAAAVTPEGRISPQDLGVWSEKHFEPLERIAR